mgnify:FL=1
MGISAKRLLKFDIVDRIIPEPLGGFHKDPELMYRDIASVIVDEVRSLTNLALDDLIDRRRKKFRAIGEFQEI